LDLTVLVHVIKSGAVKTEAMAVVTSVAPQLSGGDWPLVYTLVIISTMVMWW